MNQRKAKKEAYLFAAEAIEQKIRGGALQWEEGSLFTEKELEMIEEAISEIASEIKSRYVRGGR